MTPNNKKYLKNQTNDKKIACVFFSYTGLYQPCKHNYECFLDEKTPNALECRNGECACREGEASCSKG